MRNLNINKMDIPGFYAELNGSGNSACDVQGCGCVPNYVPKYMGNNQAKIERYEFWRKNDMHNPWEHRWECFSGQHNSFNPLAWGLGKLAAWQRHIDEEGRVIFSEREKHYWHHDHERLTYTPMRLHRRKKEKTKTIYRNRDRKRKNNLVRLFLNEI